MFTRQGTSADIFFCWKERVMMHEKNREVLDLEQG